MSQGWDFSKLDEAGKIRARSALAANNISELVMIHNAYHLSIHNYCCGDVDTPMLKWFSWALDNNLI